jgi:hypothetical protein
VARVAKIDRANRRSNSVAHVLGPRCNLHIIDHTVIMSTVETTSARDSHSADEDASGPAGGFVNKSVIRDRFVTSV